MRPLGITMLAGRPNKRSACTICGRGKCLGGLRCKPATKRRRLQPQQGAGSVGPVAIVGGEGGAVGGVGDEGGGLLAALAADAAAM